MKKNFGIFFFPKNESCLKLPELPRNHIWEGGVLPWTDRPRDDITDRLVEFKESKTLPHLPLSVFGQGVATQDGDEKKSKFATGRGKRLANRAREAQQVPQSIAQKTCIHSARLQFRAEQVRAAVEIGAGSLLRRPSPIFCMFISEVKIPIVH